jgi:hypothetical protein
VDLVDLIEKTALSQDGAGRVCRQIDDGAMCSLTLPVLVACTCMRSSSVLYPQS